jgi:hypothetical protein
MLHGDGRLPEGGGAMTERAGYLPGLNLYDVAWQTLRCGEVAVEVPALTEEQAIALAARVREASARVLKPMPTARIVEIVDAAVARLLDRDDPVRRKMEALLPAVTGYDAEMVRLGLTEYLKTFRRAQLQKFIAEDFTNPAMLDDFQPLPKGGFARAQGPSLLLHVWAGNVPGLPLWSLVSGLLVKSGSVGKVPSAEPLFAGWFAQALVDIAPELADCLAVIWWQGGDEAPETFWTGAADAVIAYGGNESLTALRQRVPVTTRFLPHGHKISFGLVTAAALDSRKAEATAQAAAYDVVRYDQQGCYSPQIFFVERGGRVSPREFAGYLSGALASFAQRFPRRALGMDEAGAVANWRGAAEMKAFANTATEVVSGPDGAWTVVYEDAAADFAPSALNRTIRVVAVDGAEDAANCIAPFHTLMQTAGVAAAPDDLRRISGLLGTAGVTRVCALGRMTAPEAGWHHDGRFSLLDLVTLVEIEQSADTASDGFAPYAD